MALGVGDPDRPPRTVEQLPGSVQGVIRHLGGVTGFQLRVIVQERQDHCVRITGVKQREAAAKECRRLMKRGLVARMHVSFGTEQYRKSACMVTARRPMAVIASTSIALRLRAQRRISGVVTARAQYARSDFHARYRDFFGINLHGFLVCIFCVIGFPDIWKRKNSTQRGPDKHLVKAATTFGRLTARATRKPSGLQAGRRL
jgi:hypothetical protein